ncbi:c-type cytochrome [Prosthecobacter dejongeii]|uniref:Mono/diheme cytochrome c family protein n=1 Tax=Prosthecobacter dejongeii TaxID=48465 RepID=A0A7W8DRX9_9BACT|nr:c-type cytochrome [Prosthecobacter dejongeii]MBB5039755.1 mono/diheme cytochrome c family protein [Prosthecobacter dejongeii]
MTRTTKLMAVLAPLAFFGGSAHAHPLQAEPINHAYVFNFDQFNLPQDPDEHVVEGGYLLLGELNCTACHVPPKSWQERLAPKPAPNLSKVGARLDADNLWMMIRSPQHRKKGTQMPGLFAGEEGDAEKVEALTEFLSSLNPATPKMPVGDMARGKDLYHKVGCVACHEPATDYRPAKAAADAEIEKPGLGSVPLILAEAYSADALTEFLFDPLSHRPSGRMPNMRLSLQEAADIAAYMHLGREVEVAAERAALKLPKQGVEKGREVFAQMNCVACHTDVLPTGDTKVSASKPKALAGLKVDAGCLAAIQPSGIPRFDLNELQKRALRLAITAIQKQEAPAMTAEQKVDWQMTRLNCYACHDRDGKGGPEDPRAQYFGSNDGSAESLGELAHLPPNLDHVGRKLTKGWLTKVLWGEGGSVRPYMDTRMPNFGQAQTEMLLDLLPEADKREQPVAIDISGLAKHHRAESGRQLMGATGLACVACHGLKERKSLGPPVIRLTHTVERLQPEYFKELLLNPQATQPGTMMPPMFMGRKKADQEIESIWIYLKELDGQPLPEGLLSTEDFELKPEKAGRPIVFRSFIEGAGSHAIAVGFPQGLHATFDAVQVRWTQVWRGRFLDAMSNWQSREMLPIKPLGTDLKALPQATGKRVFSGYRLDKVGVPTFLYQQDGQSVEDTLKPAPDGKGFDHEIKINGKVIREVLSW